MCKFLAILILPAPELAARRPLPWLSVPVPPPGAAFAFGAAAPPAPDGGGTGGGCQGLSPA